jgi:hypothetical protein
MALVDVKPLEKRLRAVRMLNDPLSSLPDPVHSIIERTRKRPRTRFPINYLNRLTRRPQNAAAENVWVQCSEV